MTKFLEKPKKTFPQKIIKWTQQAKDCYERDCMCSDCIINKTIETKCIMKYLIPQIVKKCGSPPEQILEE